MNFLLLLCELSFFILCWHSLHAKIWKGTTFSVSPGVSVDMTLIPGVTSDSVSEFECRVSCLQISDCDAFVMIQTTGCQLYSNIQKLVALPTGRLYLIGAQPLIIQAGVNAQIHKGLAFLVLPTGARGVTAATNRCFEYRGFRPIMPKTPMQFDYLLSINAKYRIIAVDLHFNATGVFFGDGNPIEDSGVSDKPITINHDDARRGFIFLNYRFDDMNYRNRWTMTSVCESNIFGNYTNY